jgi:hypothetical protein
MKTPRRVHANEQRTGPTGFNDSLRVSEVPQFLAERALSR